MLRTRPAPVEAQRLIESKPGLTHPLTWQKACRGRQQDGHRARKLFRPIRGRTSRSVAPEGETRCAPAMTRCRVRGTGALVLHGLPSPLGLVGRVPHLTYLTHPTYPRGLIASTKTSPSRSARVRTDLKPSACSAWLAWPAEANGRALCARR